MLTGRYVNIGIVTYNRLEFTKQAISSIVKYTSFPYVITVVDNGSQDGTQEYLKKLLEKEIIKNLILLEQNIGVAKASNIAWLQEPKALYYLKYDNDIVIQKNNWLSALVSVIDAIPEIGVLGYNFEPISYPLQVFKNYRIRIKEEGNIGGACFLIPKRTRDILGYWCEDYGLYGFEDVDYCFRVKLAGFLNAYMEDEEIGIHLPAGKAPIIDGINWRASDGIEEVKYKEYRNFKDLELQKNIVKGIVSKNFSEYGNKTRPLYISASLPDLSITSNFQAIDNCLSKKYFEHTNNNNENTNKMNSKIMRVDLGCGVNKPDNFIGVDIYPGLGVDIVADLNKKFPFEDNTIDEIRAHDIIEHLPDKIHTMNEIWRICKPGAKVDIRVPSTDGRGAFQDPTHTSFWNINSFLYYCVDFPQYLELCRRYGFKGAFKILKLEHEESPDNVIHVKAELSAVKSETQIANSEKLKTITNDINELLIKFLTYIEQYEQYPSNRACLANIRQLRNEIAQQLLCLSVNELESLYHEELHRVIKRLFNSGIKNEILTDSEKKIVEKVSLNILEKSGQTEGINYLLTFMLYCSAHYLPLYYKIEHIPQWLLNDYLQYMLASPYFSQVGEADKYYCYMQQFINYLHNSIINNKNSELWRKVADQFISLANFIPLYFNGENLRDIYVKRADILEHVLQIKNYEIDFEFDYKPVNRKKIKLGILAASYTPSAETFASLPVYEYLSRDFDVILYSLSQTNHQLEYYCQSCANSFKLLPQDLSEQVKTIRADDLDILFISSNVTAVTNQICLLSMHRLARIQITSGGSVVTTGMRHIDYYISGTLTDPSETAQEQYREKLIKLEGTAHCFSYGPEQGKNLVKIKRESLGISEDAVVFVSGANFFKIIPELINTWAKIIAAVPNSVLVLLPFGPNWSDAYPKQAFINHLNSMFSKHGIDINRLIVLDPQPVPDREEVQEYFKIADIYLDSYPFAGTTSLVEPLQVNLPVIVRKGNSFRSAMGAAMVQSLNIPDLVANSEESYIQLAIALGKNPELRHQKRLEIQEKMQSNPSFLDSRSYSAKVENVFKQLYINYIVDNLSQSLYLREINFIIFPDWSQPEESLSLELEQVIKKLASYLHSQHITLLIEASNTDENYAELLLSAISMNLLMGDDLEVNEELQISFVRNLSEIQWQALLSKITARIILDPENQQALTRIKAANIPAYELENICEQNGNLLTDCEGFMKEQTVITN
jgi:predicted O-linked N-acetylglucosamine transferase (SPINDLY family)/glycosyltransferase involved in cell wall biosynthesis